MPGGKEGFSKSFSETGVSCQVVSRRVTLCVYGFAIGDVSIGLASVMCHMCLEVTVAHWSSTKESLLLDAQKVAYCKCVGDVIQELIRLDIFQYIKIHILRALLLYSIKSYDISLCYYIVHTAT